MSMSEMTGQINRLFVANFKPCRNHELCPN